MPTFNPFYMQANDDSGSGVEGEIAPAPEATVPEPASTPEPQGWGGPSEDEWKATQAVIRQVAQAMQPPESEPADLDVDDYIRQAVESQVGPMRPMVEAAARQQGERQLNELLDRHEKSLGKFDRGLAERAAQSFLAEIGDPQKAVEEGAKYAVSYRKQEREAAVKEYQESLKRGPHDIDPGVSGAAERSSPPAKSYDEVIERWAGQTEV